MSDKICENRIRLICGTKEDPNDNFGEDGQELNRWYDKAAFATVLPASILLSPQDAHFRINVLSVTLDFSPLNIDEECRVYYAKEGEEDFDYVFIEPGHYSNIDYVLQELDNLTPTGLDFETRILEKKQKVRMKIGARSKLQVKFSKKIADILGFDHTAVYTKGTIDAERAPDIYVHFRPLYLCSKCLAEPCWSPVGDLPLLRQINVPDPTRLVDNGRQATVFSNSKRWVNVPARRLHTLDFYFLSPDMKSPAQFLRNSGGCVIDLEIERDKLCFP